MDRSYKVLFSTLVCLSGLWIAGGATAGGETPALTPKGIYHAVDQYHRTGVKFYVDLKEGNRPRRVSSTYGFRSGDRFTFTFEINRNSYIYVVNRTLRDQPVLMATGFQRKRIHRIREEAAQTASAPLDLNLGEPRLLFPTYQAGSNTRLRRNTPYPIPTRGHYVMDREAGLERLYVIISDRLLDLDEYFDPKTGRIRNPQLAHRLYSKFMEWKANADVELVTKGIVYEAEGYGVSIDSSKPALVEVDLSHYR